jgi:hypothetical protein
LAIILLLILKEAARSKGHGKTGKELHAVFVNVRGRSRRPRVSYGAPRLAEPTVADLRSFGAFFFKDQVPRAE